MHDLFMHCKNHHSDSHTNHVIIKCYWFDRCYNYDMIHDIGHIVDNDIKGNNIEMNTSRCNMLHNTSETIYCTEALTISGKLWAQSVSRWVSVSGSVIFGSPKAPDKTDMRPGMKYILWHIIHDHKHIDTSDACKINFYPQEFGPWYGIAKSWGISYKCSI